MKYNDFRIDGDGTIIFSGDNGAKHKKSKEWIWWIIILAIIAGIAFSVYKSSQSEAVKSVISRNEVESFINRYNDYTRRNQFDKLQEMLAPQLTRYFSSSNISRERVVDEMKKYDAKFGIYNKHFNVRWNTLDYYEDEGKVIISYIIDYYIDRRDKTKASVFVIKMNIELNSNFQITSVFETIMDKNK